VEELSRGVEFTLAVDAFQVLCGRPQDRVADDDDENEFGVVDGTGDADADVERSAGIVRFGQRHADGVVGFERPADVLQRHVVVGCVDELPVTAGLDAAGFAVLAPRKDEVAKLRVFVPLDDIRERGRVLAALIGAQSRMTDLQFCTGVSVENSQRGQAMLRLVERPLALCFEVVEQVW
jgi:hypothetical protein